VLADEVGREALHCIRCSACLNVCPVYERTGGHAYGSVYPGPIGAVLTPQLTGVEDNARCRTPRRCAGPATTSARSRSTSPRSSCTCAASTSRSSAFGAPVPSAEAATMAAAAWTMADPGRFAAGQRAAGLLRLLAGGTPGPDGRKSIGWLPGPLAGWTRSRVAPAPPSETFRGWWAPAKRGIRGRPGGGLVSPGGARGDPAPGA
jgi:L-lactate dehydrogenase complex protein LldF